MKQITERLFCAAVVVSSRTVQWLHSSVHRVEIPARYLAIDERDKSSEESVFQSEGSIVPA